MLVIKFLFRKKVFFKFYGVKLGILAECSKIFAFFAAGKDCFNKK